MMELSDDQLFELASAAHDGELLDAARDLGLTPAEASAALERWASHPAIVDGLCSLSTEISEPVPLSDFEAKQMVRAAVGGRVSGTARRMLVRAGAAAVAAAAVILVSYAVWTNTGSSRDAQVALKMATADQYSRSAAGESASPDSDQAQDKAADASQEVVASMTVPPPAANPIALGEVANDEDLVTALQARLAADAVLAYEDATSTTTSAASDQSLSSSTTAVALAVTDCTLVASGTQNGQPFGIVDAGTMWNVVNPIDCSVLRSITKPAAP